MITMAMFLPPQRSAAWQLAAQMGITHAVVRLTPSYESWSPEALAKVQADFRSSGFEISALEGDQFDMSRIKLGLPGRDEDLEKYCRMLKNMGELGIPILCYNFMAGVGWYRSRTRIPTRGGALTSGFFPSDVPSEALRLTSERLWNNYVYFLRAVLPVAEQSRVWMCLHPDDPPVPMLKGYPRIMTSAESFRRMLSLGNSPSAGITFCAATFRLMGEDDLKLMREWRESIHFVHMRDSRREGEGFVETFHDDGPTRLSARLKVLSDLKMDVLMRPDHAPTMYGEDNTSPGYATLGRLMACQYLKGIMDGMGIRYQ